jgi:hypothetical protein
VSLTPFERRRAAAVLALAAIVVVVCLATGNLVVAAVFAALTPALVYRVTGHEWREAFARVSGREPAPPAAAERGGLAGSRDRRMPGSGERVAAIAMLVVGVPVALGVLSALVGSVVGIDDATLGIAIVMTLSWTGFAGMLSGLVVGSDGPRKLIALAAGAATALSVALWVSVVGG